MKARKIIQAAVFLLVVLAVNTLAETGSAESPDFTVNTVPEPAALIGVVGALLLARRSRRGILCMLLALLVGSGLPLLAAQLVTAQQRAWPSFIVDIHYDVSDADGHTQTVTAAVSTNSGMQYDIHPTNFTGHAVVILSQMEQGESQPHILHPRPAAEVHARQVKALSADGH